MDPDFVRELIFNEVVTLVPMILAIAVHEFAHVAMARFLGDSTGEAMGRYTLNPLAHIDPIWTVLVPAYCLFVQMSGAFGGMPTPFFGAGKPAPYNPAKLDRKFNGKRISLRMGELLVAAAGPASNVVLAILGTAVLFVMVHAGLPLEDRSPSSLVFRFIVMNTGLAIFNMIPIAPLDGSKVLMSLLPRNLAVRYEQIQSRVSTILLFIIFFGGARWLLGPLQHAVAKLVWTIAT